MRTESRKRYVRQELTNNQHYIHIDARPHWEQYRNRCTRQCRVKEVSTIFNAATWKIETRWPELKMLRNVMINSSHRNNTKEMSKKNKEHKTSRQKGDNAQLGGRSAFHLKMRTNRCTNRHTNQNPERSSGGDARCLALQDLLHC